MHHIEVFSAGPLFPVVKKFLINFSSPPHEYVHPVIPFGTVFFMFTLGEDSKIVFKDYSMNVKTCMGIGGQVIHEKIKVLCSGYLEFIFAELHPIALYYLYRSSLQAFIDNFTPIENPAENELKEKILNTSGIYGKLTLVKNFLEKKLPMHQILNDAIYGLTLWVEQKGGQVSVEEMAQQLGLSERQLERNFLEKMGMSPKYYTKLIQMRQSINKLMSKGNIPINDVVYEHGHYDAAHYIKDIRRFLHTSPGKFIQEDSPLLKRLIEVELY